MKIEQLIDTALTLKGNKTNTYKALLEVIEKTDDLDMVQPLAQLLAYFIPKVKPKTPEQWVASACADKHNVLRYVYSDGARLMATNGHRLHIWATDKYPAGYYEPSTMIPIEDKGRYPEVDRVIPKHGLKSISRESIKTYHNRDRDLEDAPEILYTFDGVYVNRAYLQPMLDWMPGALIECTDPNSAVKMQQGDYLAVVMPVRIGKKAA